MTELSLTDTNDRIAKASTFIDDLKKGMNSAILGQEELINKILIAMLSNGHILLEGVPGLAKTLLIKCLANGLDLKFNRIQFTPDLMPSDITGTELINQNKETGDRTFSFHKGPLFSNIVLPFTVSESLLSIFFSSSLLITTGTPPA